MSQHDFNIANQTASNARADINNALSALASLSSGSSAPSTTYANMLWYDTGTNILKMRSEADDAWISISYMDQSGNNFRILDNTQVTNTSGTQTGLLGDQTQATWETGTATTESLVSPAKIKAAIDALGISESDLSLGTEFVQTIVPSSGSFLDITLPDTTKFSSVTIEFQNVIHSGGSDRELGIRFSTDGGSTFKVAFDDYLGNNLLGSGSDQAIGLTGVTSNDSSRGVCGEVNIYDYDSSSQRVQVKGDLIHDDGSSAMSRSLDFGRLVDPGPYNAIRFLWKGEPNFRSQGRVIVRGHRKN